MTDSYHSFKETVKTGWNNFLLFLGRSKTSWSRILPTIERLLIWLFFGVVISIMPLVFHALQYINREKPFELYNIISNGELFILSVVMASAAIGESMLLEKRSLLIKMMVGVCLLQLTFSAFYYADISAINFSGSIKIPESTIVNNSIYLYVSTLITSSCCIGLLEFKK